VVGDHFFADIGDMIFGEDGGFLADLIFGILIAFAS
jgi:hypothetical protein